MPRVEVHDPVTLGLIEILENAYGVGWEKKINASSIAWFYLPRDDAKWSAIAPLQEVWIYDDAGVLVDVFRITPYQERRDFDGTTVRVELDSIVAALDEDYIDDEVIYSATSGNAVHLALLGRQTVARISTNPLHSGVDISIDMGVISFRAANTSVMRAVWQLRNMLGGYISLEYYGGDPKIRGIWIRSDPGQDIGQRAIDGFNLRTLAKTTHSEGIVTKVFPLGRGEGRPQVRPSTDKLLGQAADFAVGAGVPSILTLHDSFTRYKGWTVAGAALPDGQGATDVRSRPIVIKRGVTDETANFLQGPNERTFQSVANSYNPGAGAWTVDFVHADYLIADTERTTWGTIAKPVIDKNLETSQALLYAGRAYLDVVRAPRTTYELRVVDLTRIYPAESFERLSLHDKILVQDSVLGVATKDRIVLARYMDMENPDSFEVAVSNLPLLPPQSGLGLKAYDIANRVRQYEGTPDGATSIYGPDSFEENFTVAQPYVRRIVIPDDVIQVLELTVSFNIEPFRYANAVNAVALGATPTTVDMNVDAVIGASFSALTRNQYDIMPYLSKTAGIVDKGVHTISWYPVGAGNTAGRVQATIRGRMFVQSRGVLRG